jgi:predicted ATPase
VKSPVSCAGQGKTVPYSQEPQNGKLKREGQGMLKKLTIKNFKAIQDMTIEFTPLTVLIGANSCGKSTVLQALDFLRSAATRDIPEYLREKGWNAGEMKSHLGGGENKPIEFIATFMFSQNTIEWYCIADYNDDGWSTRELFCINGKGVASYRAMPSIFNGLATPNTPEPFKNIKLESSLLKILDNSLVDGSIATTVDGFPIGTMENPIFPVGFRQETLWNLKNYLASSSFLGVVSPDHIRSGERGGHFDGFAALVGTTLVRFINDLSKENRKEINDIVSNFAGHAFEIDTMFDINQNLTLFARETNGNTHSVIHASHISDGVLRFVVFAALAVTSGQWGGMILLDEIENGINPYTTGQVIDHLRKIIAKSGKQIIITTHSPVMLNEFKPEEIVFLWRDTQGAVHGKQMFATEAMREALDFLNPGEIWENYGKDAILTKLNVLQEDA